MKQLNIIGRVLLAFVTSLCCMNTAAGDPVDDLQIRAELTLGEQSKDSSSQTEIVTVREDTIAWEKIARGGHRNRSNARARKEFKLMPADRERLRRLIQANELLVSHSSKLPLRTPVFYFELSLALTLAGQEGAIAIGGPRNATELKENMTYGKSIVLVQELYRILHVRDKSIVFEELVREGL